MYIIIYLFYIYYLDMNIRKRKLEIILQSLNVAPSIDIKLEQYPTPIQLVSEILFIAESQYHDIYNKRIIDLGCGSGFFAIGASILGADFSIGIDKSWDAIKIAITNGHTLMLESLDFILADVTEIPLPKNWFHTTFQNPPFGIHNKGADVKFLYTALNMSKVIYSIHKSGNYRYLKKFIESHNAKITDVWSKKFPISSLYPFHKHRKHIIDVEIYRIVKR